MNKLSILTFVLALSVIGCSPSKTTNNDDNEFTVTISFSDYPFSGNTKEISTHSAEGAFENAITSYVSKDSVQVTSVSAEGYVGIKQISTPFETGEEIFNTLQISSGTESGLVTLNFSHLLKRVKITAQGYYKSYEDHWTIPGESFYPISIDLDTTFLVNNEAWTLPEVTYIEETASYEKPVKTTKTFNINSNSLTISDDENLGRVFIHEMQLTFSLDK